MTEIEKKYVSGSIAVQFQPEIPRPEAEWILVRAGVNSYFGGYLKGVLFATVPPGSEDEILQVLSADSRVHQAQRNVDLAATFPDAPLGLGVIE